MQRKGLLFVLIGPSGAGKNTLLKRVVGQLDGYQQMPTATTRPRRPDEHEGVHHFFMSDEEFDRSIQDNAFIEWQEVHGKRYGSLKSTAEQGFATGKMYIADIDVLGAKKLKDLYSRHVVLIFVTPSPQDKPNLTVLEERIRQRGHVSDEEIAERLGRAQFEFTFASSCDYILENDDLDVAIAKLKQIILVESRHV